MSTQHRRTAAFNIVVIGALAAAACNKSASEAKAEQASPAGDKSTAIESQPEEMKNPAHARVALSHYESIRASLATDAVAVIAADATALEKSARSAATGAKGEVADKWKSLAEAAKRLHEMSKDDADGVRKAFGDTSQHLVAILAADKALAEGLHVFECPMAQGYKKWVQPAARISNPYMGTRMPECGSESSL